MTPAEEHAIIERLAHLSVRVVALEGQFDQLMDACEKLLAQVRAVQAEVRRAR